MILDFLKTKRIFWLSLVVPVVQGVNIFLEYKQNPIACGSNFKLPEKCESFLAYLNSFSGSISVLFTIILLGVSLGLLFGLFLFLRGKRKLGVFFLSATVVCGLVLVFGLANV